MQNHFKLLTEKPQLWDTLATHPLQSWAWGEFRKKTGVDVVRLGKFETSDQTHKTKLKEGVQITFHKIPKLPFTIGYAPKGPMPTKNNLDALAALGKQKNAIFIQLEPNTSPFPLAPFPLLRLSHHSLFTKYTFVLDLTKSENDLLNAMHSKTRYNIKVAKKHNVVVREDSSQKAFDAYLQLTQETTKRQGFYAHTEEYHRKMWETLSLSGIAKLFTASYKTSTLASWIIFCFKDTIYYPYGASSRQNRDVMAPNLLLWEIALWGKSKGYKKFDLWGALGPNPNELDPFYGFHRFKAGFCPELVEFAGSFDLVVNHIVYPLYCVADTIRWKILKAKK